MQDSLDALARARQDSLDRARSGAESATPGTMALDLADVYFDYDRATLRSDAEATMSSNAAMLQQHPSSLVTIEGHCDERGTNEYNLALGERRAKATMNYLVGQGVQANRITIISYGKERPTCTEHTESCWAQNRRAHFLVKAR